MSASRVRHAHGGVLTHECLLPVRRAVAAKSTRRLMQKHIHSPTRAHGARVRCLSVLAGARELRAWWLSIRKHLFSWSCLILLEHWSETYSHGCHTGKHESQQHFQAKLQLRLLSAPARNLSRACRQGLQWPGLLMSTNNCPAAAWWGRVRAAKTPRRLINTLQLGLPQ